jgi:hypothetical protein
MLYIVRSRECFAWISTRKNTGLKLLGDRKMRLILTLCFCCSCIPCGHFFGRSCLERWLMTRGTSSALVCHMRQFEVIYILMPKQMWACMYAEKNHFLTTRSHLLFFQCPNCRESFQRKDIINLHNYIPEEVSQSWRVLRRAMWG